MNHALDAGGRGAFRNDTRRSGGCRREHAGADYTVQASTVVIASSTAAALSGVTAQYLGYAGHFTLAFTLGVVALVAVVGFFPSAGLLASGSGSNDPQQAAV